MTDHLEEVFAKLGTGRWNIFHFLALSFWFSLPAYHTLGGTFLAPKQDFECIPSVTDEEDGVTSPLLLNVTQDQCSYTVQSHNGSIQQLPCTQWNFDNSTFYSTVTSEFQLVCGLEYLRATYTSIYMFGIFVGAPLNGVLADRYGRLPLIAISSILYTFIAIGSCWLPNLSVLLVSRFLLGTMHPTSLQTGYILAMEVAAPKRRSELGVVLFLPWALGTAAWGGFAYLVRHWRYLQLTVSLPCFLFLPTLLFMDESPRWLVVRGSYDRALKVLKKAAHWNKVSQSFPSDQHLMCIFRNGQNQTPREKKTDDNRSFGEIFKSYFYKSLILLRTPRLRLITIVMYIDYLIVAMVYFGLSLSGSNFSTDPFLYITLSGLVEIPGNTVSIPLVTRIGRRALTTFFFLLSGGTLLGLPFVPKGIGWLEITLLMIGKMSITMVFNIIFLYASELFPTEVRTRGMGTSLMLSRVGSMMSPFITQYLGSAYPSVPSVLFGVASLLAGAVTVALPETRNTTLIDTVAHLEQDTTRNQQLHCRCWPDRDDEGSTSSCCGCWAKRNEQRHDCTSSLEPLEDHTSLNTI
ncbi:organic cation transporter protein-like [Macrobrachium rosenbergii]|uniref:organic cation transporter protein-like n=1 Tax=Macrobrachium rosenbergii TaxID=79674 RepID=UPI0034D78A2B